MWSRTREPAASIPSARGKVTRNANGATRVSPSPAGAATDHTPYFQMRWANVCVRNSRPTFFLRKLV